MNSREKLDIGFFAALALVAIYMGITFQFLLGGVLMVLIAACWVIVRRGR